MKAICVIDLSVANEATIENETCLECLGRIGEPFVFGLEGPHLWHDVVVSGSSVTGIYHHANVVERRRVDRYTNHPSYRLSIYEEIHGRSRSRARPFGGRKFVRRPL